MLAKEEELVCSWWSCLALEDRAVSDRALAVQE